MFRTILIAPLLAACLALSALSLPAPPYPEKIAAAPTPSHFKPIRVVVSIPPLEGLVEPLLAACPQPAPEANAAPKGVTVLIPPGASEHGYEIPPAKLAELARADLVLIVGLGLEPQIEKFLASAPSSRSDRRVVRFADEAGIAALDDDHEHADGDDHQHDHGAADPHLWLDPVMCVRFVAAAHRELCIIIKERGGTAEDQRALDRARDELVKRLKEEDAAYRRVADAAPGEGGRGGGGTRVVSHDAYGWLC
ncbi:MAG: zinc ABC transporter substrate-binding protein, partial [Phycisphaerales bacterium]|nr:zinc ABC transporter substrate-binding protein [Phycisphaerales bacterium]